ncbi:MAG TPA: cytochrome c family protein [Thermoanaerobaculia bacterium]|nr:cytochrome c family protein [Thermoanaerobaculia bacterium]
MKILLRALGLAVGFVLLAASASASPSYVGAKKCRACHIKQFQSWEKTRMARAFELLRPGVAAAAKQKAKLDPQKDYTHDEKCVGCHTTGHGSPGGFVSFEQTPELVGVQCESCHGPGGDYLKAGGMTLQNKEYRRADLVKLGLTIVGADTCTSSCHNNRSPFVSKDYVFDYAKRRTEGTHEHIALKYAH